MAQFVGNSAPSPYVSQQSAPVFSQMGSVQYSVQQPMQQFVQQSFPSFPQQSFQPYPVQQVVQQQAQASYPIIQQPLVTSQPLQVVQQPMQVVQQPVQVVQQPVQQGVVFEAQEIKSQRPKLGYTSKMIKVTKNNKVPVPKVVEKIIQIPKIVYEVQLRPVQVLSIVTVPKVIEVEEEEIVQEEITVEREIRIPQRRIEEAFHAHGVLVPFVHSVRGAAATNARPAADYKHYDYYVWKRGDTVAELGRYYNCSTQRLLEVNGLSSGDQIADGRVLRIPLLSERGGFTDDGGRGAPRRVAGGSTTPSYAPSQYSTAAVPNYGAGAAAPAAGAGYGLGGGPGGAPAGGSAGGGGKPGQGQDSDRWKPII